ncbi:MAG TPA: hypothetical protein VK812_13635 [Candidatus Binatus sp.]|jgi:hypothetical protein|nr:hypothetical protein [Candidatus Binatus sp.]
MEAISGVFKTRARAQNAVQEALKAGISHDRITLLTPGSVDHVNKEIETVPVDTTEQPGMGEAMGALAGGGIGFAGGAVLMALVPGLGPITAVGLLGAAILGAAGATIGATAGNELEKSTTEGLPEDEIFVYEDALRQGRSVVVVLADGQQSASLLRDLLTMQGAESIDAAREQWWIGLRNAEESHYSKSGRSFAQDEEFFRLGFESALHARTRCLEFDQVSGEMNAALEDVQRQHPGEQVEAPFTHGYQRGREYYQHLCDDKKAA